MGFREHRLYAGTHGCTVSEIVLYVLLNTDKELVFVLMSSAMGASPVSTNQVASSTFHGWALASFLHSLRSSSSTEPDQKVTLSGRPLSAR
jgi:hypothetical protein